MQRTCLILFIISISFVTAFGQMQSQEPTGFLQNFWKLALQNDFEEAKKLVTGNILKDNNYIQMREDFTLISESKLQIREIYPQQIVSEQAFYKFNLEAEDKRFFFGEAILILINSEWKIIYFRVREGTTNIPKRMKNILPFLPRDYRVNSPCPKCG